MKPIFISHSTDDALFATELKTLLKAALGDVDVQFSSDRDPAGGIDIGEDWRDWIRRQIKESGKTIVLLTPASIQSEWVHWEAGAVEGAALARGEEGKVIPLAFGLSMAGVPGTLSPNQVVFGDDEDGLWRMLSNFMNDAGLGPEHTRYLNKHIENFLEAIEGLASDLPAEKSEGTMQEWISRLDEMRREKRASEVASIHRWIELAFRGELKQRSQPLDQRIHRRLGELYLESGQAKEGVAQLELALKSAPRDIFLLRSLGQAYIADKDLDEAKRIIERIRELDPDAFEESVECAGLKGRWHRERGEVREARDAYQAGWKASRISYYMSDNVAQLSLQLGEEDAAREAFEHSLEAITMIGEKNVWTYASAATAHLYLAHAGEDENEHAEEGLQQLHGIHDMGATIEDKDSIKRGLDRVAAHVSRGDVASEATLKQAWRNALDGRA